MTGKIVTGRPGVKRRLADCHQRAAIVALRHRIP